MENAGHLHRTDIDELHAGLAFYLRRPTYAVRALVETDRAAVQTISTMIFRSHDYAGGKLSEWLARDGIDLWTAAVDGAHGDLAGFEVLVLYDGGLTGWLEGLRVHPYCRGRGVAKATQMYLVGLAQKMGLKRVRLTTPTENIASRRLALSCGMVPVAQWAVVMPRRCSLGDYAARLIAARRRLARRTGDESKDCNIAALESDVSTKLIDYARRCESPYLLQSNWKAYDFGAENLATLLQDEGHQPPLAAIVCRPEHVEVTSFSWSFHQRDSVGLTAFATVYSVELSTTLAHLSAQFDHAIQRGATSAMFMYDPRFEPDLFRLGLVERCRPSSEAPHEAKCVILYERDFAV